MKRRFILYRRKLGGTFYVEDTETRKQESLGTKDRAEATSLLNARNESVRQPQLNLQIAKAYLAGTDSGVSKRTWQGAFDAITENKHGPTKERWQRAVKQKAFDLILPLIIIETQAEQLFACLKAGTVSTNVHLRELHNFCISMNWLAWPIIAEAHAFWRQFCAHQFVAFALEEFLAALLDALSPHPEGLTEAGLLDAMVSNEFVQDLETVIKAKCATPTALLKAIGIAGGGDDGVRTNHRAGILQFNTVACKVVWLCKTTWRVSGPTEKPTGRVNPTLLNWSSRFESLSVRTNVATWRTTSRLNRLIPMAATSRGGSRARSGRARTRGRGDCGVCAA